VLNDGDIVIMQLAAGYRGYSAQIGSPVCIGEPPKEIRRFFDDIVLPGFEKMVALARGWPSFKRAGRGREVLSAKRRAVSSHSHSRHRLRQLRAAAV
jgi:Xaa-Pro aminopeptidase